MAGTGTGVVGGFCELGDDTGVRAVYRKAHLWNDEKLVFEPGEQLPTPGGADPGGCRRRGDLPRRLLS